MVGVRHGVIEEHRVRKSIRKGAHQGEWGVYAEDVVDGRSEVGSGGAPEGERLIFEFDDMRVPVLGVCDREIAATHVEVNYLAQGQIAAGVEIGAGQTHV